MNERIRELIKNSGGRLQFNREESPTNQYEIVGNENIKTLVDLIIQECGEAVVTEDEFYGTWMYDVIKKHFGVEE